MCTTRPSFTSHRGSEGFSLVEVLIAVGILVTAAAAIPHLFAAATRANAEAGAVTWATTLAAQKIEELRSRPVLEAVAGESVDFIDQRGGRIVGPDPTSAAYTRRWWVEAVPSASAQTFAVAVAVSRYREGDDLVAHEAVAHRDAARLVTLLTETAP
jgi:Tfp pilus assembly protein PilV